MVKVVVWPSPPAMVKLQCPAPTGVIVKLEELVVGEMIAMPLHELGCPVAGVVAVNCPPKFDWLAVTVCEFAAPVPANEIALLDSVTLPGAGVVVGADVGVGVGVGVELSVGAAVGVAVAEGDTDGNGVGDTATAEPPEPLQATQKAASIKPAHAPRIECVTKRPRRKRAGPERAFASRTSRVPHIHPPEYPGKPLAFRKRAWRCPRTVDDDLSRRC